MNIEIHLSWVVGFYLFVVWVTPLKFDLTVFSALCVFLLGFDLILNLIKFSKK